MLNDEADVIVGDDALLYGFVFQIIWFGLIKTNRHGGWAPK